MNVLLVSPYRGKTYESVGIRVPPLGLLYIGGVLREAGHDIELDLSEDADSQDKIDFSNADVVGITSTTSQFKKAMRIAHVAKEAGKMVIMGGPHPTSSPDEALRSGNVDYIVRSEGEATAVELLKGIEESNGNFDPSKVLGVSWYDRETDTVVNNPPRPFIWELDSLPYPARDLGGEIFDYRNKGIDGHVSPTMITTRGCPYGCRFCDVHVLAGRKWRARSPKSVADEVEYLVTKYGAEDIRIMDDIINHDNEELHRLLDAIIERNFNITFWVMGRADMLLRDPSTADKMAKAGVRAMFIGIETPSKRILKTYHKGGKASADTSAGAVDLLRQHGIETYGGFIIGEPTESEEEIKTTIEYAKFVNPATAQFSILTPYPGTEIWNQLRDKLIVRDWDKFDGLHAVFHGKYLTAPQLESWCRKAYIRFYLRPKRIAGQIASAMNGKKSTGPRLKTVSKIFALLKTIYPKEEEVIC
ncbi:radical SAM protein [candidate division KSB1 bacterium]|nr:radical SAM protein [candidate division KSB1 bacterium]NIR71714.1 radical SAM protein [candidate division KSB1 bacterium]NIS28261.1 radical SAM protein [candidate division KSB1 bacterium]NIT70391.1 radical SAM protein [candidate division KSB1 bacterium]NIU28939.1 radical SAM protein [candidate division KSB1 bacterium]